MEVEWRKRINAVVVFSLAAVAVAWLNRESLYYLDAWILFTSLASIPLLFLLGAYQWERTHPEAGEHEKKDLATYFTVVISLMTAGLFFTALFISFVASTAPTSNLSNYDFVIGKRHSAFTAHFPRSIPADARAVRFQYIPGGLQSVSELELGYTTTPDRVDRLYREYTHRSTLAFTAGEENGYIKPVNYVEKWHSGMHFSEDYTLFYLDEHPPKSDRDWNHTHSHGVAISKKRCRVVFWASGG